MTFCNRKNESALVKIRSVVAWEGAAEGVTGKGHKITSWCDRNILYIDRGVNYMDVSFVKND